MTEGSTWSWWLFAVPYATAAAFPGPAQAAMLARAVTAGPRGTLPFVAGMMLGTLAWLVTALLGLGAVAGRAPGAFGAIRWLGAAWLAWFAWRLWRAPGARPSPAPPPPTGGLLGGAALTLGNPKALVFFGAILPQAVDLRSLHGTDVAAVLALALAIDAAVQGAYLVLAGRARRLFAGRGTAPWVSRAAALVLGASALAIALRP
jgi:threonine/homoserine/homoserine lactone efflux protein